MSLACVAAPARGTDPLAWLELDDGGGHAPSPLELALGIAAIEPVCDALESWLGGPFDVEPAQRAAPASLLRASLALEARERLPGSSPPTRLRLGLPDALALRRTAPSRELLELCRLSFEPVEARCRLASLPLSAAQLARLGAGAVLLLPDSFAPAWPVALEMPSVRLALGAILGADGTLETRGELGFTRHRGADPGGSGPDAGETVRRSPISSARPAAPGTHEVRVHLDAPFEIDPAVRYGLAQSEPRLPERLEGARVTCRRTERDVASPVARGRLIALGDGYGMLVDAAAG